MKQVIWKTAAVFGLTALVLAAAAIFGFVQSASLIGSLCAASGIGLAVLGGFLWKLLRGLDGLIRSLHAQEEAGNTALPAVLHPVRQALQAYTANCHRSAEQAEADNRDLTFRIQSLQRQKTSVEAILHSIRDAVLVTDGQDQIVLANPAAEELLEFQFESEDPKSIDAVISEKQLREKIRKSRNSQVRHVRHELTFSGKTPPRTFDAVFSCLFDQNETVSGVVVVLHDMTREKEISQMKNEFVSHVSHELKTPLASINAYAEMLVDGEVQDTETIQEFCSIIQGQALRLNRLIEDILNISRIESGLIKVHRENHSIALVIRDAVEMIKSYAQEKNITVHSQAPILYDQACVDRDMISQVVINLLSNAVKYTPAGGSVTIQSEVNEADGRITVTVQDTGVGIPAEEVDHVFDKFYRVEANNKCAKGTGLGLNLVKQIVETVHGGSVFVTSKVGEGSTFGFELPLAEAGSRAAVI